MPQRKVENIVHARPATDGAGVKINRMAGFSERLGMDPFLMLDEIRSDSKDDFIAGFPPHPHRGFETVTYMREGGFSHKDSMGNSGTISTGGAQWMTAGSGVIHSEMPIADADRMHGFQFWLNLPSGEKMQAPAYRDIQGDEVVAHDHQGSHIRLIAGSLGAGEAELDGVVTGKTTRALIADVTLSAGGGASLRPGADLKIQFYVYQGSVRVGNDDVKAGQLAFLTTGDELTLSADADSGLLLFGGRPIEEPVAHHGPFVMNTPEEIEQAIMDYRDGTLVRAQPT